jgi:hypothetical protein
VDLLCKSRGRFACVLAVLAVILAVAPMTFAQGTQSGIISGSVTWAKGPSCRASP